MGIGDKDERECVVSFILKNTILITVTTECFIQKYLQTYTYIWKYPNMKSVHQTNMRVNGRFSVNLIIETALAIFVWAGGMYLTSAIVVI